MKAEKERYCLRSHRCVATCNTFRSRVTIQLVPLAEQVVHQTVQAEGASSRLSGFN